MTNFRNKLSNFFIKIFNALFFSNKNNLYISYSRKLTRQKVNANFENESVVHPYFCQVREKLGLQNDQKVLILCDAFKPQSTDKVTKELERLNIV